VTFDWLTPSRSARRVGVERRLAMYQKEIAERAGLYYRLGYPPSRAIARLSANLAWDFEAGRLRPAGLDERAIADLVKATYLRRPAR
jgi:hypothetical protein